MSGLSEDELLAKMEELNRNLQMDSKSVHKLSTLTRNDSVTSDLNQSSTNDEDKISLCSLGNISSVVDLESKVNAKWDEIMKNFSSYAKRKNYLKDLIKESSGIPALYRPIMWQLLCGCTDDNTEVFKIRNNFPEYLKQQSPCERAIRRDIARTYPHHEFFKSPESDGQERLFNIMKAYSIYDREVGYCQGTGFIGGLLLIHMPEEEAFSVLVMMMFEYQLRHLYKPSMSELGLYMHQLDCLVEEQLPKLAQHFRAHNFHATVYASGWFLTLFTLPFSIDLASRVMDLFLLDGIEILFRMSLAYLTISQDELLKLDMESMLRYLQSIAPEQLNNDSTQLFEMVSTIKLNSRKMKKAEKEYLALKVEEEENQVELRRLRTENGLLLQRIDRLEKEIDTLTQSLVTQKLTVAEQSSELVKMHSELCESKRQSENLRKNLNGTENQLQLAVNQLNRRFSVEQESLKASINGNIYGSNEDGCMGGDLVQQLQTELVNVRLKEAETNAAYRELKDKYRKIVEENKILSKNPTEEVARLQEDFVALKLKEAETNLALKDSQKRISDLAKMYKKHIEQCPLSPGQSHSSSNNSQQHQSSLLQLARQVVEAEKSTELSVLQHKLMQHEAQREITSRQIERRDREMMEMTEKVARGEQSEKELRIELQEADRRCVDIETKRKEDLMMWKIQKMEMESQLAELKQHMSRIETERVALDSYNQLSSGSVSEDAACAQHGDYSENSDETVHTTIPPSSLVNSKWKDLPNSIMTDSIGPIDELCFTPDDPMITSIYIHGNEKAHTNQTTNDGDNEPDLSKGGNQGDDPSTPTGDESHKMFFNGQEDNMNMGDVQKSENSDCDT